MRTIELREETDDNGETCAFSVRIDNQEGYGVFYPCVDERGNGLVSGYFCGWPMEASDIEVIAERLSKHVLIQGNFKII